ncbi:unnamed protein product, partial [Musa banksii]
FKILKQFCALDLPSDGGKCPQQYNEVRSGFSSRLCTSQGTHYRALFSDLRDRVFLFALASHFRVSAAGDCAPIHRRSPPIGHRQEPAPVPGEGFLEPSTSSRLSLSVSIPRPSVGC